MKKVIHRLRRFSQIKKGTRLRLAAERLLLFDPFDSFHSKAPCKNHFPVSFWRKSQKRWPVAVSTR